MDNTCPKHNNTSSLLALVNCQGGWIVQHPASSKALRAIQGCSALIGKNNFRKVLFYVLFNKFKSLLLVLFANWWCGFSLFHTDIFWQDTASRWSLWAFNFGLDKLTWSCFEGDAPKLLVLGVSIGVHLTFYSQFFSLSFACWLCFHKVSWWFCGHASNILQYPVSFYPLKAV